VDSAGNLARMTFNVQTIVAGSKQVDPALSFQLDAKNHDDAKVTVTDRLVKVPKIRVRSVSFGKHGRIHATVERLP